MSFWNKEPKNEPEPEYLDTDPYWETHWMLVTDEYCQVCRLTVPGGYLYSAENGAGGVNIVFCACCKMRKIFWILGGMFVVVFSFAVTLTALTIYDQHQTFEIRHYIVSCRIA